MSLELFEQLAIPFEPVEIGHGTDGVTLNFLSELLRYTQPQVIVEAGTFEGSFTLLARAVCPQADIFTADIRKHQWHGDVDAAAFFFLGDFSDMLKWVDLKPDFAFIDSGPAAGLRPDQHEDRARIRHYEAVMPRMKRGGIVATHDTRATDWQGATEIIADASIQFNCGRGLSLKEIK